MLGIFGNLHLFELLVIAAGALLIFGQRLPEVAVRGAAQVVRLRRAVTKMWREAGLEEELRKVRRQIEDEVPRIPTPQQMVRDSAKPAIKTPSPPSPTPKTDEGEDERELADDDGSGYSEHDEPYRPFEPEVPLEDHAEEPAVDHTEEPAEEHTEEDHTEERAEDHAEERAEEHPEEKPEAPSDELDLRVQRGPKSRFDDEPEDDAQPSTGSPDGETDPESGEPAEEARRQQPEPPAGTPEPPAGTPEPPAGTPEPPAGTPEPPAGTPEPPAGTKESA